MDIVNGELIEIQDRNFRKKRKKTKPDLDPAIIHKVKKPKKVKPGYKKKLKAEMEKQRRLMRRRNK
jgi:ATP-dependent RNA helicase CshB